MTRKREIALVVFVLLFGSNRTAYAFTLLQGSPILQVSQIYDDNTQLSPSKAQADLVTDIVLGFNLNYSGSDRSGSFEYETLVETFLRHQANDNFLSTHLLEFKDLESLSNTTTLNLYDSFLASQSASALFSVMPMTEATPTLNSQIAAAVLVGTSSTGNVADARLDHRFGEQTAVEAELHEEYLNTGIMTSIETQLELEGKYKLSRTLKAGVAYDFYDFRFNNAPSPIEAHFPRLTWDWTASRRLSLKASAGPIVFQMPRGGGFWCQPGYAGSALYETTHWHLNVAGGQAPGIDAIGGAGVVRSALVDLSYALTRRASIVAGLNYYSMVSGGATLDFQAFGGGFNYRLTRHISAYMQYLRVNESGLGGLAQPNVSNAGAAAATAGANLFMLGISFSPELFRKAL